MTSNKEKTSGTKGLFSSIEQTGKQLKKEDKNVNSQEIKNLKVEELSIKRSYSLKPSTVKKLQELKVFVYDDPNITFNEIVDEAICKLYESIKKNN